MDLRTKTRLADEPPIEPERLMPLVARAITWIAIAIGLVGVGSLWPELEEALSIVASPLAASTVLFATLLTLILVAMNGIAPDLSP